LSDPRKARVETPEEPQAPISESSTLVRLLSPRLAPRALSSQTVEAGAGYYVSSQGSGLARRLSLSWKNQSR